MTSIAPKWFPDKFRDWLNWPKPAGGDQPPQPMPPRSPGKSPSAEPRPGGGRRPVSEAPKPGSVDHVFARLEALQAAQAALKVERAAQAKRAAALAQCEHGLRQERAQDIADIQRAIDDAIKRFEELQQQLKEEVGKQLNQMAKFNEDYNKAWNKGMDGLDKYLHTYLQLLPGLKKLFDAFVDRNTALEMGHAIDEKIHQAIGAVMAVEGAAGLVRGVAKWVAEEGAVEGAEVLAGAAVRKGVVEGAEGVAEAAAGKSAIEGAEGVAGGAGRKGALEGAEGAAGAAGRKGATAGVEGEAEAGLAGKGAQKGAVEGGEAQAAARAEAEAAKNAEKQLAQTAEKDAATAMDAQRAAEAEARKALQQEIEKATLSKNQYLREGVMQDEVQKAIQAGAAKDKTLMFFGDDPNSLKAMEGMVSKGFTKGDSWIVGVHGLESGETFAIYTRVGDAMQYVEVTPAQLAKMMRDAGYKSGPVRLVSCYSGTGAQPAAQQLAKALETEVTAPRGAFTAMSNGGLKVTVADGGKSFVTYGADGSIIR